MTLDEAKRQIRIKANRDKARAEELKVTAEVFLEDGANVTAANRSAESATYAAKAQGLLEALELIGEVRT